MEMGKRYLVVDSRDMPLARAVLESGPESESVQIRVLDGVEDVVMEHELVQLISLSEADVSVVGRIIRNRGPRIVLERVRSLSNDVRQNLRIPARFESYIYPVSGDWAGRRAVTNCDISCGGVAFFTWQKLEPGERIQLVVPITSQPLLMNVEVIRKLPSDQEEPLYACKFADMLNDEETLVREAVFSLQLQGRHKKTR